MTNMQSIALKLERLKRAWDAPLVAWLQVRVPKKMALAIKRAARLRELTISQYVRIAVAESLHDAGAD
jgi:hypothetical protein